MTQAAISFITPVVQMDEQQEVQSHVKDLRESYKKRIPQDVAYRKYQIQNLVTLLFFFFFPNHESTFDCVSKNLLKC